MFLSDWRVLVRRWYIVLLGIQATVVLCYAATVFVPVTYQATSDVLLLPPKPTSVTQGDNPFLSLGGLDTVSGVLARTLSDRTAQVAVQKAGGTGTYTVVPDLTAGGPVLLITVEDTSPARALKTLEAVTEVLPPTLAQLQTTSGVRPALLIRSKEITRDTVALTVRKSQIRALLAAAAAGLGGTVLLASLFDGFLTRRAERRKGARKSGREAEPVVEEFRLPLGGEPALWPPRSAAAVARNAEQPDQVHPHQPHLVAAADMDAEDTMEFDKIVTTSDLRPAKENRQRESGWNGRRGSTG